MWGAHNEVTFSNWKEAGTWQPINSLAGYAKYEKIADEYERDALAMGYAKQYIFQNLTKIPRLCFNKFLYYWNFWPRLAETPTLKNLAVGFLSFGWLLPFFIGGVVRRIKDKRFLFIWFYLAYFNLITFASYGSIRMRMPITPLVIIVAVGYLDFLFNKRAE